MATNGGRGATASREPAKAANFWGRTRTVTQLPHKGVASGDSGKRVRLCSMRVETVGTTEIDVSENMTIVSRLEQRTADIAGSDRAS